VTLNPEYIAKIHLFALSGGMDKNLIASLRQSKDDKDREVCITLLRDGLKSHPSDIQACYDLACCYDFLGRELEAEPCYQTVYELGPTLLPSTEQPGFYLGYGSTLRNNVKLDLSTKILLEGIEKFPGHSALKVFLGFTFYSAGKHQRAAEILFEMSRKLPTTIMDGYERAIGFYCDRLAEK